ncbi:MAG: hypothetical protein OEW11_05445 [Nitrospirota bacterium]|nr:hypothetical protein [Nitrospirota bacterium]
MFTVINTYLAITTASAILFFALSARMSRQRPDSTTTLPPVVELKQAA